MVAGRPPRRGLQRPRHRERMEGDSGDPGARQARKDALVPARRGGSDPEDGVQQEERTGRAVAPDVAVVKRGLAAIQRVPAGGFFSRHGRRRGAAQCVRRGPLGRQGNGGSLDAAAIHGPGYPWVRTRIMGTAAALCALLRGVRAGGRGCQHRHKERQRENRGRPFRDSAPSSHRLTICHPPTSDAKFSCRVTSEGGDRRAQGRTP